MGLEVDKNKNTQINVTSSIPATITDCDECTKRKVLLHVT